MLLSVLMLTTLLGTHYAYAHYNPADDDVINENDDDVIVMTSGRPNMKHFQTLMELQDIKGEKEKFEEVDPPPDELITDDDEEEEENEEATDGNRRRFVLNNPHKIWDHGILPYKFDSALPTSHQKNIKEVVIPKYEYWTHFRFPEWNSSVPKLYNLSHQNYLLFAHEHGCWSHVGCNKRGHGQKLSCCKGSACVHEIGHSIGFHHEQSNPLRDDYIRIDYQNILDGKGSNFGKKSFSGNRGFGYFDIGSIMEYGEMAFSKDKKNTITVYDPDLEYLLKHQDTGAFYMFYEAQTLYKMKDQMCSGFPIQCQNDGYVSYINNTCECRCPTGMDSRTGCATPSSADIWPEGEYAVLKPESGCPAGFIPGELKLKKATNSSLVVTPSSQYHVAGSFSKRDITLSFCTKRYKHMPGTAPQWDAGKYCIFKSAGACPKGFSTHLSQLGPDSVFSNVSKTGIVPEFSFKTALTITTCCREDGNAHSPIKLPTQTPAILMPASGQSCQTAAGMGVHQEIMSWTSADSNKSQSVFPFCYYAPTMKGISSDEPCGDMIYLSDSNPTVTVTSPHYPSDYNGSHPCSWFVKGIANSKISMEFSDFSIHAANSQNCDGHLELRYYLPGEPGVTFCGTGFNKTIVSNFETLYMILTTKSSHHHKRFLLTPSGGHAAQGNHASRRFKVTFTLLKDEDLCYTDHGKDNSYQGKVNYGHNFERCLPWDQVPNCPHNMFNEVEHDLESNFCRNPGYGTEPWCYTNAETCARAYCDSCQLRRCYDLFADCRREIHNDPDYCTSNPEAVRGCRLTCGLCGSIPKTSPVSIKTCRRPALTLPDGKVVGKLKSYYRVGEKVKFACNVDANETHVITCTSEGTWTHLSYACGGCPYAWRMFDGHCYKFTKSRQKKTTAIHICQQEKHGAIISPAESEKESDFLKSLAGANHIWLGGHNQITHGHNNLVWEDGQKVNYTNWLNDTAWPEHGNKKCLIMSSNKVWDNTNCAYKNMFICRAKSTATQVCLDQRTDCSGLIERTPDLCIKYAHTFSILKCAKSCGLCTNKGFTNTATCTITDHPSNASVVTTSATYHAGNVMRYNCNKGYQLAQGNLIRACKLSGQFSGSPPTCLATNDMVTTVGDADIRRRHKVGAARTAYTLSNKYNRIQRTGEITAWQFYSNHGVEVALQVWRQIGNTTHYKLTGQNVVSDTLDDRQVTVNITKLHRVSVQPGDFIGIFFPRTNHGGITYDDCKTDYDPEGGHELQLVNRPYKVSNWIVGHQYSMKLANACKIFSLKAFIGPV